MTLEKIHESLTKAYAKVDKCSATIERHKKTLENKIKAVEKLGFNPNMDRYELSGRTDSLSNKVYWLLCDISDKREDIKNAEKKLIDARRVAENLRLKYQNEVEKNNKIDSLVPPIIKEFLEDWKEKAIVWQNDVCNMYLSEKSELRNKRMSTMYNVIKTYPEYEHTRKALKFDYSSSDLSWLINVRPKEKMIEVLEINNLSDRQIRSYLMKKYGRVTIQFATEHKIPERGVAIRKYYEREMREKILDLMDRISSAVGEITDATGLSIGVKGGIEGVIHGTIGSAIIETIGAGGYNIQCFHYRTLVHKIK